jgi:hypothetical protein
MGATDVSTVPTVALGAGPELAAVTALELSSAPTSVASEPKSVLSVVSDAAELVTSELDGTSLPFAVVPPPSDAPRGFEL